MSAAKDPDRESERRRPMAVLRKVWVLGLGIPLVAIGIVLLPLPGPGSLVIIAGLAVLATEFDWASRQLTRLRQGVGSVFARFRRDADE